MLLVSPDSYTEHARYKMLAAGVNGGTTYYLSDPVSGAMEEQFAGSTNSLRDYIVADGHMVGERFCTASGPICLVQPTFEYFVLDHLGSISVITNSSGAVLERLSYDAWGKRRNPDGSAAACGTIASSTIRGFTGQEMMDTICFVNLNARVYDPSLGRFMSADPILPTAYNLQALNRYAYVLNNPLSLTDTSGLCFLGCFWQQSWFREVLGIAVAIVLQQPWALAYLEFDLGIEASAATLAVINGGIAGGIAGAITTGTLKGAALGAFQGALFAEAGNLLQKAGPSGFLGLGHTASVVLAHGFVGGIVSIAGGGRFESGFLAAGVGSLGPEPTLNQRWEQTAEQTVEHAVLGGLGSVLGGGKFANGAATGAFGYLLNSGLHASDPLTKYRSVIEYGHVDIEADVRQAAAWGQEGDVWDFYAAVRTGGIWDFKDSPVFAGFQDRVLLADFGNFHLGLVADAFGFSEGTAIAGAGTYQTWVQGHSLGNRFSGTLDFFGSMLLTNPVYLLWGRAAEFEGTLGMRYGDYPEDTQAIINGYNYYDSQHRH